MTYPQSFYADLFDSFLDNVSQVKPAPPRGEKLREIASSIQRDDAALADQLISAIRQPYQDALLQYYREGKSCTQMAREQGITFSGAAHRKRTAMRLIRELLMDQDASHPII